jgi:hypothetical protein
MEQQVRGSSQKDRKSASYNFFKVERRRADHLPCHLYVNIERNPERA